ncbi:hypothetical protein E2562_025104 [Oryza meyeriana var. granulata]|uniref:Uncharacterized protein n=1 Tax=Oryza meyeriana var. granulata TaxID=110450 RepID=A0A6G1CI71_9ORYZ|nr:hypothetical protein E2562_025104 [Oryza meyeriana var. granulata]
MNLIDLGIDEGGSVESNGEEAKGEDVLVATGKGERIVQDSQERLPRSHGIDLGLLDENHRVRDA